MDVARSSKPASRRRSPNQTRYQNSGNMSIKHALLDDAGNGLGSCLIPFAPASTDGILAKQIYLQDRLLWTTGTYFLFNPA